MTTPRPPTERTGMAGNGWRGTLLRWLLLGHWRAQPGRTLVAVAAVAIGVALALGIHLVNDSALAAFGRAIATVNGEADLQVRPDSGFLDEALLDPVAATAGVANASPMLELQLWPVDENTEPAALTLLAIDVFAALQVTPALRPVVDAGADGNGTALALFAPDAVFLSDAARQRWPGPTLTVRVDGADRTLRVVGGVPGAAAGQRVAVMNLGSAQWAFDAVGRLSRIDLRLADDAAGAAARTRLAGSLPAGSRVVAPDSDLQRMSNLSRAYRVNLDVLALVALLTGGFIVLASMSLAAVRQQPEMALLRVLGAPASLPLRSLLLQGLVIGLLGSAIGCAGGVLLARALLDTIGGDLGGGFFSRGHDSLQLQPARIAAFGCLGLLTAIAGAAIPAWRARHQSAGSWLRAGSTEQISAGLSGLRPALALLLAGAALLALPAWQGLPIAAYLAIAAFLFAGIALVPTVVRFALGTLRPRLLPLLTGRPVAWLALTRLGRTPGAVAIALAGVVASFALTAAMLIMVTSFRGSVDDWLDRVLPADLYARAPVTVQGSLDPSLQAAIAAVDGIAKVRFLRSIELHLDPAAPAVMLLARDFDDAPIEGQLPLTGPPATNPEPDRLTPVWVSEAMVSRHGWAPGTEAALPLAGRQWPVFVAGVWRDYARQTGAVTLKRSDYRRLSGDDTVSDVAIWLPAPDTPGRPPVGTVIAAVRAAAAPLAEAEFRSADAIRTLSLRIFDRSFAVTYVLEAIALVVGLFGVASSFAAEALHRAREFGMLRHLGVTRRMISGQLGLEAAIATTIAVVWGGLLGLLIGAVLIFRVNPQSFHWTMDLILPTGLLLAAGLALIGTGVLTAMWASRSASADSPVRAVREAW